MPAFQLTVNGRVRTLDAEADTPAIDTVILANAEPPPGMGEPPVPLAIPAVLNAVFAATGRRIRQVSVGAGTFK